MAAFTAVGSALTIPKFRGLRADAVKGVVPNRCSVSGRRRGGGVEARAWMEEKERVGAALLAASAASVMIAGGANAMEVLMGGSGGELAFIPSEFSVAAGETIVFKNNAGFPHNVIFDEDEVPAGVDTTSISMPEEDLLNAPGETYKVTLDKKGTYKFYCSPHQGVGMSGRVTVN